MIAEVDLDTLYGRLRRDVAGAPDEARLRRGTGSEAFGIGLHESVIEIGGR